MKKTLKIAGSAALASLIFSSTVEASSVASYGADSHLKISQLARYDSNTKYGESGTEIAAYDHKVKRVYSINGAMNALDIIDAADISSGTLPLYKRVLLSSIDAEGSDITSVAVHPKHRYIAVSVPAGNKTDAGAVVFLSMDGELLSKVKVGSLPDMLTFTHDGKHLLVANEGEPSDDYKINPEGSLSIIKVNKSGLIVQKKVKTRTFNPKMIGSDVRELGPDKKSSFLNLEPEYITVDDNDRYAYVSIQERNAVAKFDIERQTFVSVKGLGLKDYRQVKMDASDKDNKINMKNYPVMGMYQPDGIAHIKYKGKTYLLTANEGDTQDYSGYSEEKRTGDIADQFNTSSSYFKGFSADLLTDKKALARLKTSTSSPLMNNGKYDAVVTFGGRSFSVLDSVTMKQVYDSGDDFETITAKAWPNQFNGDQSEPGKIEFDGRSDDKGPEPESVTVGTIGSHHYAFIGLERANGIMVYNIDNPVKPKFEIYFKSADNGDISPEGITFIPEKQSPSGQSLLLVSHEMSGTIAAYSLQNIK